MVDLVCIKGWIYPASFFHCISLTHPSFALKGSCDYIESSQIIQDNIPILRSIILILSAKSHFLWNITCIGLTPEEKDRVVPNPVTLFLYYPYAEWTDSAWAFTYCIHLLCDLGLPTFIFMQSFQSGQSIQSRLPRYPTVVNDTGPTSVCLLSLFFHSSHWHLALTQAKSSNGK